MSSFQYASPCQDDQDAVASNTLSLNCETLTILKIKALAEQPSASPCPLTDRTSMRESFLSPAKPCDSPQQQAESLDSRIESLLITCQNSDSSHFDEATFAAEFPSQDSLASATAAASSTFTDESLDCLPVAYTSFMAGHQPCCNDLLDVDPTLPDENEEDETKQAVSFLQSDLQSPAAADYPHSEKKIHASTEIDAERFQQQSHPTVLSSIFAPSFKNV